MAEASSSNSATPKEDRISAKKRSHGDTVTCTACSQRLDAYRVDWMRRHPLLGVLLCKRCFQLHSREIQVGEDGMDEACRWCALEGDLICCDFCHNVFCKLCIRRNLGRAHLNIILNAEDDQKWQCYVCNPEPLQGLVASCSEVFSSAESAIYMKATKRLAGFSDLSDEASAGSSPKPKRIRKSKITVDTDDSTSVIKNDELEGTVSEKGEEINDNEVYNEEEEEEEDEVIEHVKDGEEEEDEEEEEEEGIDVKQVLKSIKSGLKKSELGISNEDDDENEDDVDEEDLKRILSEIAKREVKVNDVLNESSSCSDPPKQTAAAASKSPVPIPAATPNVSTAAKKQKLDNEVVYIKTPTGEIVGLKATSKSFKSATQPSETATQPSAMASSMTPATEKKPKGRPKLPLKKLEKCIQMPGSTSGKKYPRASTLNKNTPSSLAAVAGLKLSSRPPIIDQNNVWNVLERLLAATQSMTMLLTSLKEDLRRAAAVSSGFTGPGKIPDLKKKRKEQPHQQHQSQQQQLPHPHKLSEEFLRDDLEDNIICDNGAVFDGKSSESDEEMIDEDEQVEELLNITSGTDVGSGMYFGKQYLTNEVLKSSVMFKPQAKLVDKFENGGLPEAGCVYDADGELAFKNITNNDDKVENPGGDDNNNIKFEDVADAAAAAAAAPSIDKVESSMEDQNDDFAL
ncbi:hypothetical protein HELRODRAFT_189092 [Helobdella robusta]|uniref:PHD-type domain-containing protein n=1 Tax=Helobdella robusta TaxID=6412 RepID=T1FQM6_HELRO|nr:hypothetical protein HELRODRAFT_189092 [Helobdella robusta]ESN96057.1 hypothetical protein HELRODRAFT_189092 [Helobdella robusta]